MGEILQEGPSGMHRGEGVSTARRFTCAFCSCPGLVVKGWHRAGLINIHFHPWVGKSPWRRAHDALQYPCLENPMDSGAWQATAHRVTESWTCLKRLSTHACYWALMMGRQVTTWNCPLWAPSDPSSRGVE